MRRLLILALLLTSLASTAQVPQLVEPFRPIPAELRTRLEGLRTSDIAEQRRRWGALADLAGKVWISFNGFGPITGGFEAYWVIEGAALQVYHFACPRDEACQQSTWLITAVPEEINAQQPNFSIEFSNRPTGRGFTDDDEFFVVFGVFNTARFRFDRQTGVGGFSIYRYRPATEENLKQYQGLGVVLESQRAEREKQAALAREQAAQALAKAEAARKQAVVAVRTGQEQAAPQRNTDVARRASNPSQPQVAAAGQQPVSRDAQPAAAATRAGNANAATATKPLRFVLYISMRNLPGDRHNSNCYSNIITRPGPPGWGAGGFQRGESASQANAVINGLKAEFIAKCRSASGRDITSEGNFGSVWNQLPGDEERVENTRPRFREDVSVSF